MGKKDEEMGKGILAAVKSATKEVVGGSTELVGAAKDLNDMLTQAIDMQQNVTISLYRVNQFSRQEEFLSQIDDVPPELIKSQGLEPIIQNWSGGGKYRGVVRGAGIPDKKFNVVIGGDPELPRPLRTNSGSDTGGLAGLPGGNNQQPLNAPFNMGGGMFSAGPGFAGYMGMDRGFGRGGMGGGESQVAQMQANQIQQLIATLMAQRNGGGDSDALQLAKEDNRKLEMQRLEDRRQADQDKADARHKEEMAEMRRGMEQLADKVGSQKEDPTVSMLKAIVPMAGIAIPLMVDGKAKAASAQTDMVKAMMGTQKESSDKSLGMMELMLKQPTTEDRQAKQAETVANLMGNTMQLMGSFTSQMSSMQGDGGPPWMQVVMKLLEGATEVGANMFAGGVEPGQQPEVQGQASVQQPAPQQIDAGQAAAQARAAMEAAAGGDSEGKGEESDGAMGEIEAPARESYHQGLKKIFDLIEQGGNPHAIAFRIWKDATSGDVTSSAWLDNPERFTFDLLGSFVDAGQMSITEERATEIADALQEFHDHLKAGKTAEAYRQQYAIRISMPKKIMRDPMSTMDGKDQPLMGEAEEGGVVIKIEDVDNNEEAAPLPEGPQTAPPPVVEAEAAEPAPEGPQNVAPPVVVPAQETITAIKEIENGSGGIKKSAK